MLRDGFATADPTALVSSLRARGLTGADLVREKVCSKATKTRLLNGKPVRPAVLRRVNTWLKFKPELDAIEVLEVGA